MPTKDQLRDKLAKARKAEHQADEAIKDLVDLQVPSQARADKKRLLKRLRRVARRMGKRIPILKRRIAAKRKGGAQKAVAAAREHVGTVESPYGSNRGPHPISACQVFTIGYDGVPWCGCEVALVAIEEGGADIPLKARLAYTPYIDADAAAGANGLEDVPFDQVEEGDFVVFHFGSGGAKHVGIATGPFRNGMTQCVEGNTSSGSAGSQDNGGGVFYRERPISHVICVARPDYR